MSELTKEYFDQIVAKLVSKDDLKSAVAPLATSEQIDELARMVSAGFDDVQMRLNVTEELKAFERKFSLVRGICGSLMRSDGGPEVRLARPANAGWARQHFVFVASWIRNRLPSLVSLSNPQAPRRGGRLRNDGAARVDRLVGRVFHRPAGGESGLDSRPGGNALRRRAGHVCGPGNAH